MFCLSLTPGRATIGNPLRTSVSVPNRDSYWLASSITADRQYRVGDRR